MIYFKVCPKCEGDLEVTVDEYHTKIVKCFQCSFITYLPGAPKQRSKQYVKI